MEKGAISHFNGSHLCKSIVYLICYVFLVQSCVWMMPPPSLRHYPAGPISCVEKSQGILSDLADAFRGAIDLFLPAKAYAAPPVADAGGPYGPLEGWHPIAFDGSGSTADEGIAEYYWDFGEYTHTFDGTQINYDLWVAPSQVTQNDEILITGASVWGYRYFFSRHTYQRGSILEALIKTPSTSYQHLMVGFKRDNETYHYNQMTYAIYFASGSIIIYEDGSSRGRKAYYTRGLEYEVRIELKKDAGAIYYFRENGSTEWTLLYNSNYSTLSSFKVGADVHSASFAMDNIKLITHAYDPVATVPIFVNQAVTLTVTDNIGQSASDTTAVSVQIVTGNPPVANPGGPYTFGEAFADCDRWTVSLDGTGSTDDYEIRTYQWTFGDYTHTFDGTRINNNLWITPPRLHKVMRLS